MDWFAVIVAAGIVLIAAITDVRTLKVHNWLTIPAFVTGLAYHLSTGGSASALGALFNAGVVFGILLIPYLLGAMGAGDLKLVAAVATWLGTSMTFSIAAISLFATGIYSLAMLLRQGRLADTWLNFQLSMYRLQMVARHMGADEGQVSIHELAQSKEGRARLVPFSAMLAFGTIVSVAWLLWSN